MDPIKRVGPPVPIDVRGTEYDLSVPLSATPSAEWRRAFQTPDEWKDPCHPSRIKVKDRSLIFTSEETQVGLWIQLIDTWIAAANGKCADLPASLTRRQAVQDEQAQERLRRIQEATERFRDL